MLPLPRQPVIRLYKVPSDAFEPADDVDEEELPSDNDSDRDGFGV